MVAVLSTDAIPQIRMNVDEYLTAILPEGFRYELVEGVVEMSPVPELPHDVIIDRLVVILTRYRLKASTRISHLSQRAAVTNPARQTAREPDLAAYAPAEIDATGKKGWKDMTPLLVVEVVSQGQESRDYVEKRRDYWDAGVGEYWIVDPQLRKMTVLTRAATDWIEQTFDADAVYSPAQFPGLEVSGVFTN